MTKHAWIVVLLATTLVSCGETDPVVGATVESNSVDINTVPESDLGFGESLVGGSTVGSGSTVGGFGESTVGGGSTVGSGSSVGGFGDSTVGGGSTVGSGSTVGGFGDSTVGGGFSGSAPLIDFDQPLSSEYETYVAMSAEDGICALFDAYLDWLFTDDYPVELIITTERALARGALESADDGPLGEKWQGLLAQILTGDAPTPADLATFDETSIDQCGFAAFTAMSIANSRGCFIPIRGDGQKAEPKCGPVVDPRK